MKGRVIMMMLPCVHLFKFHQIKCISLSFRKNIWRGGWGLGGGIFQVLNTNVWCFVLLNMNYKLVFEKLCWYMYLCYFMVMHVLMLGYVAQLINWKMWPFYGHLTWIYWHVSVHQQVNPRLLTRFCRCIVFICRINWLIIALMKILMLFPEGLFSWICFFF